MSNCYSADAHFVQVATEVRTAACESILSTCIYARGNLTQEADVQPAVEGFHGNHTLYSEGENLCCKAVTD